MDELSTDTPHPSLLGTDNVRTLARVAVYDDMLSSPRIIDIAPAAVQEFIDNIVLAVYDASHQLGGSLPYTVIREITENFIHADFAECTVSVLDGGNTLRFSDQGPGIQKKSLVLQPGVSSATVDMKRYIRGVGSGFPIVKEYLERSGGFLSIDDNATSGVVVTITAATAEAAQRQISSYTPADSATYLSQTTAGPSGAFLMTNPSRFSDRISQITTPGAAQENVLRSASDTSPSAVFADERSNPHSNPTSQIPLLPREDKALRLLLEEGMLGPVDLATALGVSAPTATRVLQKLERLGMVETTQLKKRILSNVGLAYVQRQINAETAP
ncbi:MAG: MarR family transcriptional regulator [Coriobacteriales bacterium]|jgi:anti-sigma regulatory factor (Ser/Thr protein kinase)|nr:MarR family transcriptional regulator [Coriobacteriales bacterium]